MSKLSINQIIQCSENQYGIVAEIREDNLVVIEKGNDSLPFLAYYKPDEISSTILNISEQDKVDLNRFFEFYINIATKTHSLKKAAPPGTIAKRVQVRGKHGTYSGIRYVRVKAPKVKSLKKKLEKESSFNGSATIIQSWREHLTPSEEQYQSIIEGNREQLGDYIINALWKPTAGEGYTEKTQSITQVVNDIAKRITGVRPDGFEPSDIMQETAIKLMEMQDSGRFKDNKVPRENFAGFVANIVRNTSLNILRKQQLDKYAEQDISEWANDIADTRIQPFDEALTTQKGVQTIHKNVKETYAKLPKKYQIVLNKILNNKDYETIAKDLNISVDAVKNVAKRSYQKFRQNLNQVNINIPGDGKGVIPLIKDVLKRTLSIPVQKSFLVQVAFRNGKLVLLKAQPQKYEIGAISPKTGKQKIAPGKWVTPSKKQKKPETTETPEKKESPKVPSKNTTQILSPETKTRLANVFKEAFKGILNTITDVLRGEGAETAIQEGQRASEMLNYKRNTKIQKPVTKNKNKNKNEAQ